MHMFKISLAFTVFSLLFCWIVSRFNKPYPWNNIVLDNIEGLCVVVFIPSLLICLGRGIWLL